jgi:large subunit ribosomal protein L25
METKLVAQRRPKTGTSEARRQRAKGLIPGNIYGHKQDAIPLLFSEKEVKAVVVSTHRAVDIELDGKTETTILREVRWDTFHTQLQHVDFMRVDANERVTVDVEVILKGTAAGTLAGGLLEQPLHKLSVDCLAIKIPEGIIVKVQGLQIGDVIHVRDLEIPEGIKVHNIPDAIVARVIQPIVIEEPTITEAPGPAEPEVIKKEKKTAEEGEEKEKEKEKPAKK